MKCCQVHWAALRAAIRERGLERFVANGGAEAMRRTVAGEFEPLLMANHVLFGMALEHGGLNVLYAKPDGSEHCPVCFLNELCTCGKQECPSNIISNAANAVLVLANERGILGAPS